MNEKIIFDFFVGFFVEKKILLPLYYKNLFL